VSFLHDILLSSVTSIIPPAGVHPVSVFEVEIGLLKVATSLLCVDRPTTSVASNVATAVFEGAADHGAPVMTRVKL